MRKRLQKCFRRLFFKKRDEFRRLQRRKLVDKIMANIILSTNSETVLLLRVKWVEPISSNHLMIAGEIHRDVRTVIGKHFAIKAGQEMTEWLKSIESTDVRIDYRISTPIPVEIMSIVGCEEMLSAFVADKHEYKYVLIVCFVANGISKEHIYSVKAGAILISNQLY